MSSFSKILNEKLKKQDISLEEISGEASSSAEESVSYNGLGIDLLKWLNSSPLSQKQHYKIEESSYSIYKKDPKVIAEQRLQREKTALNDFLSQIPSEKEKESVLFFYTQGARAFLSKSGADLKRDYKKLAFKLHPDRHFNEIPSVQRQSVENFRVLSESYECLQLLFSRAK